MQRQSRRGESEAGLKHEHGARTRARRRDETRANAGRRWSQQQRGAEVTASHIGPASSREHQLQQLTRPQSAPVDCAPASGFTNTSSS